MSKETKSNYKNAAAERLGETRTMNCGEIAFIVKYENSNDITVKFEKTGEVVKTTYQCFKKGEIKSRFTPSVYGMGVIGNEKTKDGNGKSLKSYETWKSMLRRCYDKKYKQNNPTYKDVNCCEEWHNYSNFKKWYEAEKERLASRGKDTDRIYIFADPEINEGIIICADYTMKFNREEKVIDLVVNGEEDSLIWDDVVDSVPAQFAAVIGKPENFLYGVSTTKSKEKWYYSFKRDDKESGTLFPTIGFNEMPNTLMN